VQTRVSADIRKNIFTATEEVTQGRTADTTLDMAIKYVTLTAAVYCLAAQFTAPC